MLKRVGRYLKGRPRLVWRFDWQSPTTVVDITSDANWAGCRRTRKSTTGGTIMLGNHLIRSFSKTQAVVAKSSGESELYGIVRASTGGLGMVTLLGDFGMKDATVSIDRHWRDRGHRNRAESGPQQGAPRGGRHSLDPGAASAKDTAAPKDPRAEKKPPTCAQRMCPQLWSSSI